MAVLGVSMRACVFPLTLRTMKTVAVIKKLQPFLKPVQDEMREAQQSSDLEAMKAAKAKQQALMSSVSFCSIWCSCVGVLDALGFLF